MFDYLSYYFLSYVIVWTVLIPIVVGAFGFKNKPAPSKALYYFLIYSGVCDVIVGLVMQAGIDNRPGLHFYTVGELLILSWFFKRLFNDVKWTKRINIASVAFVILAVINLLYFQPLKVFSTYTRTLEAFVMLVYCFIYFERESRVRQAERWEKKPNNWFVTGLLTYFGGAFFFFMFSNVIRGLSNTMQYLIWDLHGFFQVVMYILISVGYIYERRSR